MALSEAAWQRMVHFTRTHAPDWGVARAAAAAITNEGTRTLDFATQLNLAFALRNATTGADRPTPDYTPMPKRPAANGDPRLAPIIPLVDPPKLPVMPDGYLWTRAQLRDEIRARMSASRVIRYNVQSPMPADPYRPIQGQKARIVSRGGLPNTKPAVIAYRRLGQEVSYSTR